jgi:plastocyanin
MIDARHLRVAGGAALACLLLVPAAAHADASIVAGPSTQYLTTSVSMDQGERLTFYNFDAISHDVSATTNGPDGQPLFKTPLIDLGESAFVEGSEFLTTGSYDFLCTIHSNMQGTLEVTSAGTPAQRPTPGNPRPADNTRPTVKVKLTSARAATVRRKRKLFVEVSVDEAAQVAIAATARVAGKRVTLTRGSIDFTGAGKRRNEFALLAAGRKAVKRSRRLKVTVSARAVDRAGNAATAKTTRRLG